ncbi:MAG: imidazole glycerol phosphate synthase subunit HisH [Lachnospiraceae bacterium]|jgi:glutamine amidotransferase
MTAIIDYDAGNIASVQKALHYLGDEAVLTSDPAEIERADRIILPGVGAFGDAMKSLRERELVGPIREACSGGTPFLGICVGLQLMFDESEESPGVPGLGLLRGKIVRFPDTPGLKVPHMGWNSLSVRPGAKLFAGLQENPYVYFVHSYYLKSDDPSAVAATADYGVTFDASVEKGNLFGCQFHPEKSSVTGLRILKNFLGLRRGS